MTAVSRTLFVGRFKTPDVYTSTREHRDEQSAGHVRVSFYMNTSSTAHFHSLRLFTFEEGVLAETKTIPNTPRCLNHIEMQQNSQRFCVLINLSKNDLRPCRNKETSATRIR